MTVTEHAIDVAVLAAKFERPGIGGDRLVQLSLLDVGQSHVLVGSEEIRELPNGRGIGGDGGVEVAELELEVGESEIEGGAGLGGDTALEQGDRGGFIGADQGDEGSEELLFFGRDLGLAVGEDSIGAEEPGDEGGIAPELGAGGGGRLGAGGNQGQPAGGQERAR